MKKHIFFPLFTVFLLCCLLERAAAQDYLFSAQPPDTTVTLDLYLPLQTKKTKVKVAIHGEYAVLEGDILLGKLADLRKQQPVIDERGIVCNTCALWPNSTVPYHIEAGQFSQAYVDLILEAIDYVGANTNMCLVPRTNEQDYVMIVASGGCWSSVGKVGGVQQLGLNDITDGYGCSFGAIVHELSHAAGLWHEQSREDRDEYVVIHWNNIDPAYIHNFYQHIQDGQDVGPYDYYSIMHYGPFAFSINGQPTITRAGCGGTDLGGGEQYTLGDIETVNYLYSVPCGCYNNGPVSQLDAAVRSRLSGFISTELHHNYKLIERAYIRHQLDINHVLESDNPKYRDVQAALKAMKEQSLWTVLHAFVYETDNLVTEKDLTVWRHFLIELDKAVGSASLSEDLQKISRLLTVMSGKDMKAALIAFDRATLDDESSLDASESAGQLHAALHGNPAVVTILKYELPEDGTIEIALVELNGVLRRRIFSESSPKGKYELVLDKRDLPPGIYFVRCVFTNASGRLQSVLKLVIQ